MAMPQAGFLRTARAVTAPPSADGSAVQQVDLELHDAIPTEASSSVRLYEYHIVYHTSYGVPVLMFQGRAAGEIYSLSST